MASRELESLLARFGRRDVSRPGLDIAPGCAFGAVVDQRLKDLAQDLAEVKGRLNSLIFLVASAVVVDIVIRLAR